jgi:methionine--tRNA ligase beta chain
MISFDDFKRLDIRIASIKEVKPHPNADRLYVLTITVGDTDKVIIAGIKDTYPPEELTGKKVVVLNNLEPVKIRGIESSAMVLAAKDEQSLTLLVPDKDIAVGSQVS